MVPEPSNRTTASARPVSGSAQHDKKVNAPRDATFVAVTLGAVDVAGVLADVASVDEARETVDADEGAAEEDGVVAFVEFISWYRERIGAPPQISVLSPAQESIQSASGTRVAPDTRTSSQ